MINKTMYVLSIQYFFSLFALFFYTFSMEFVHVDQFSLKFCFIGSYIIMYKVSIIFIYMEDPAAYINIFVSKRLSSIRTVSLFFHLQINNYHIRDLHFHFLRLCTLVCVCVSTLGFKRKIINQRLVHPPCKERDRQIQLRKTIDVKTLLHISV